MILEGLDQAGCTAAALVDGCGRPVRQRVESLGIKTNFAKDLVMLPGARSMSRDCTDELVGTAGGLPAVIKWRMRCCVWE